MCLHREGIGVKGQCGPEAKATEENREQTVPALPLTPWGNLDKSWTFFGPLFPHLQNKEHISGFLVVSDKWMTATQTHIDHRRDFISPWNYMWLQGQVDSGVLFRWQKSLFISWLWFHSQVGLPASWRHRWVLQFQAYLSLIQSPLVW